MDAGGEGGTGGRVVQRATCHWRLVSYEDFSAYTRKYLVATTQLKSVASTFICTPLFWRCQRSTTIQPAASPSPPRTRWCAGLPVCCNRPLFGAFFSLSPSSTMVPRRQSHAGTRRSTRNHTGLCRITYSSTSISGRPLLATIEWRDSLLLVPSLSLYV